MKGNKRVTTTLLVLISIISAGLALYFGLKSTHQKREIEQFETSTYPNPQTDSIYIQNSESIDSLILLENYAEAQILESQLKTLDFYNQDHHAKVRRHLLSNLVEAIHHSESLAKETAVYNASLSEGFKIKDSIPKKELIASLNEAESKIRTLKNRLKKTSENEYLTFKTSKGTSLHYVGQIKKNKANGFGIALLETGSRYEGNWKDNMRHGEGKFYWDDGEHYEGSYVNDKRQGKGTYFWKNGEKYVGEWKEDRRNGVGKFYSKKGKIKASGVWENDKLVKEDK